MSSDWPVVRLGDVISVEHGWPFKSRECTAEPSRLPIMVAIGNFRYSGGFRFESTTVKHYLGEYPSKYELAPGDLLLIMTCQTPGGEILGIPGRVPDDGCQYLHNQRIGKVVAKSDRVSTDFLYHLSRWQDFNRALVATASGTKILHTSPARIEAFEFGLPPLAEQQAIAEVLGALDDKIALNRRMNRTLEEMAAALFRSWFVDFDPVVARADGRAPFSMDAETAALFPDAFVDSEEGPIPEGWRVRRIRDVVGLSYGKALPKRRRVEGPFPVYGSGGISGTHAEPLVKGPGVVMGRKGTIGALYWEDKDFFPIDTTFYLSGTDSLGWLRWVYFYLRTQPLSDMGSDSAVPGLNRDRLYMLTCVTPPAPIVEAYEQRVSVWFDACRRSLEESRTLAALRDTLLPQLLSGTIRLRDAERQVGEA